MTNICSLTVRCLGIFLHHFVGISQGSLIIPPQYAGETVNALRSGNIYNI